MKPKTVVSGALIEDPREGMTTRGARFVSVRLREDSKGAPRTWQVLAFSDHGRAALGSLAEGAYVAVIGAFDARIITEGDAAPRIAWRITGSQLFSFADEKEEEAQ